MATLFDIIGPVMIGPLSSHTAGACRIGKLAKKILGEDVKEAKIYLHGSFALTWKGHGTDKAILAGLLGFETDDARLRDSYSIADKSGLKYEFIPTTLRDAFHPNSAGNKIHLRHNGKANMAFYDGHAEAKSFEEFNAIPSAILTWGILQKKTFLIEDFSELQ